MIRLRRATVRAAAFAAYLVVVGGMLALIFLQSVKASADRRALLEQVRDLGRQIDEQVHLHRDANQSDHDLQIDCLTALSVLLADPERDRSTGITPPEECERPAPPAPASQPGKEEVR